MPNSVVGLRLGDEIKKRLQALGKLRDRSANHLAKEAITQYLESQEALEAEKRLTRERWEAFELTGESIDQQSMKDFAANLGKN